MAEYLYVCHFSNGHIKVGRSISPKSRIASHVDRVACVGIELVEHHIVECVGHSAPAESELINHCAELATKRNKSEWFEGLDFLAVCEAANFAANITFAIDPPIVLLEHQMLKEEAIRSLGGTAKKASEILGCTVQAIYMWPNPLPIGVADRVRGVVARMAESLRQPAEKAAA